MINYKRILYMLMLAVQSVFLIVMVGLVIYISLSDFTYPMWDFRFACCLIPIIAFLSARIGFG